MYAHEETITELGISKKDLPAELQARIRTFTNKARLSKRPETLEQLEVESEDLANEVLGWFNDDSDNYDDNNDNDEKDDYSEQERLEAERVRLENEQRQAQSQSQQQQQQQQQQNTPPPKEESSGWGINTNW